MSMQPLTLLFIILSITTASYLLDQWLDYLNLRRISPVLPDSLKDIYDEEKYKKSVQYQKEQLKFSFFTSGFGFLLSFVLLAIGFFGWLDGVLRLSVENEIVLALSFFGILFIGSDLLQTPFQVYQVFVMEEKFGFNKTTRKTFLIDKIKGHFLTAIIGGLIIWILLKLIMTIGSGFWIWFLVVIALFLLFVNMFYTSLIVPLFNKLSPLQDGELKQAINDYSAKVGFPVKNILVIDGSKRSSKANAFFSGIGKKKKIVLYDTLINNHTTEELVAVLAHEAGHYKKKHVVSGFVLSIVQIAIMLFILSLMVFNENLSIALGGTQLAIHLNLLAFAILYSPISLLTGILMNIISRKNEFEADAYATKTFDGRHLHSALKKLSVDNLSNVTPHPLYVFFHYSHPPLIQRLQAIENQIRIQ